MEVFQIACFSINPLDNAGLDDLKNRRRTELFVNTKSELCDEEQAAMLESEALAVAYASYCQDVFLSSGKVVKLEVLCGLVDPDGLEGFAEIERCLDRDSSAIKALLDKA